MDIEGRGENPFDKPNAALKGSDPAAVARKAAGQWKAHGGGGGTLELPVLYGKFSVTWPDIDVEAQPGSLGSSSLKLLTLLYLANTNGSAPSREMVAYRQLPGGRFYEPVVQRSVEAPLADAFGSDVAAFRTACASLGGRETRRGDASCAFTLFPGVVIEFLLWGADEEFAARAQVLFDSSSTQHLGAFDLRMAAQEISGRLIKLGKF